MEYNTRYVAKMHGVAKLAVVLVCLCILSVLAPSVVKADTSIKIAMITAKTGVAGKSNSISFVGARFSVDTINDSGGILGRRVELLEYDNRSTPEGSAAAARQALKDGAVAVVGCNWSSHSQAMAEVLQEAGVPMISHFSTNPSVTRVGDFIFRICFIDSFQGFGLASFALDTLGRETAVVLVDSSRTYSIGLAETFIRTFVGGGGKLLWRGEYTGDDIDFDGLLKKVARLKPEVLFVPGGYEDLSVIFGNVRQYGIQADLLTGDGIGLKMYNYIGSRADGIYFSNHWSRWIDSPESKDFVERFEAKNGPITEDTHALVYDSFMLLKDAMERAGSVEGTRVRDALAATDGFKGVTGTIRFDEYGDPIKSMSISRLKFGGVMYLEQFNP